MTRRAWFRDRYADALWAPNALRPNEVLVGLAYAKYAGDPKNPENDVAWLTYAKLAELTGMRSKGTIAAAVRGLQEAGWLVVVEPGRQHYSTRYRLVIPDDPEVRFSYRSADDLAVRNLDN